MISTEDYERSRSTFWKLIAAGDDLQHAWDWRAQYLHDHDFIHCKTCGLFKPLDSFYRAYEHTQFEGYMLPCKECKKRGHKEKAQEKRSGLRV